MTLPGNKLALVHIAAKAVGLDDDTYRDMLEAQAGVRSAKALDWEGFRAVMRHLEKAGFRGSSKQERAGYASRAELNKIRVMWHGLAGTYYEPGKEAAALRGFLKKRFHVEHERFLTGAKARQVIEALKSIASRNRPRPSPVR